MMISAKRLVGFRACEEEVKKFQRIYGTRSVRVTEAECLRRAQSFSWSWAAQRFFNRRQFLRFSRAADKAIDVYRDQKQQAEFHAAEAETKRTNEYDKQITAARRKLNRALASAFGRIAEGRLS